MDDANPTAKLAELIEDFPIAMLTTLDEAGRPVAQPFAMQQQHHGFDGELWFLTSTESSTVARVASNPALNVALSSNSSWVSATGTGELSADRDKISTLWDKSSEAWFPDGPDDERLRALIVHVESAEYWDTPGGNVATVLSYVKSKISGSPMDIDNEKLTL